MQSGIDSRILVIRELAAVWTDYVLDSFILCIYRDSYVPGEREMLAHSLFDFWSTVDNSRIYWKQETEAAGMLYIDSMKLILLNKNVSHYWLNKHIFCGRCHATVIYYLIWYRNMAFNLGDGLVI
jgi:hypothetical protein